MVRRCYDDPRMGFNGAGLRRARRLCRTAT